ncbi:MAG: radical SAM family heme chaperone HemW [Myxococcales bacterium]|nr:radical SAM family heme chaperone HemW [Myxococcales bacterium]
MTVPCRVASTSGVEPSRAKLPSIGGIYIHFPFCRRRCHYCDFNTYAVLAIPVEEYTSAIIRELETRAESMAHIEISSVFLGGGTPGLWGADPVRRVLECVRAHYRVTPTAEITIEVNPGECGVDLLRAYRDVSGCNRVSFGVQSLSDKLLAAMDRLHSADQARQALQDADRAGFRRYSADLMFGLPGQSLKRWVKDVREIASMGLSHVSLYNLMVEPNTPLYLRVRDNKVRLPREKLQVEMLEQGFFHLAEFGLTRYEISNFAKPGQESVHNLHYWQGRPYLGVGAGAHSFVAAANHNSPDAVGIRTSNVRKFGEYMKSVQADGTAIAFSEEISPLTHLRERLMTGLRLIRGVDLDDVKQATGIDPRVPFGPVISSLVSAGLVQYDNNTLSLSEHAIPISDSVFARFF